MMKIAIMIIVASMATSRSLSFADSQEEMQLKPTVSVDRRDIESADVD